MKKNKKTAATIESLTAEMHDVESLATEVQDIAPEAVECPVPDARAELVKKAKAAKEAAACGLISQDVADAIWAEAEAACKPSEESLALAQAAKEAKAKAERLLKVAQDAFAVGLIDEDAVAEAQAKVDAAKAAYTEAANAARGFSFGIAGGGPRCKGQMSGLDAAYRLLSESDTPLNAVAIAKAAIERGLWAPDGQTPVATLSGALQTDCKKGEKARFVKVSAGHYDIRK